MTRIVTRSPSVFRGRGGPKRQTSWFNSADLTTFTTLVAGTAVLHQTLTAAELAKRPFTVVRVRGTIWVITDQAVSSEAHPYLEKPKDFWLLFLS